MRSKRSANHDESPTPASWTCDGITFEYRKGSKRIQAEFWIKGRRIRRSTGKTDPEAAETVARRLRVEAEERLVDAPPLTDRRLFVETVAAADIKAAEQSVTNPRSADSVTSSWVAIARHIGTETRLTDIDISTLRRYREDRRKIDHVRDQTVTREWQALKRTFVRALEDRDMLANRAVAEHLRTMIAIWPKINRKDKQDQRLTGHLRSVEVIRAVCEAATSRGCNKADGEELRDKILFSLMTGLRHDELLRVGFWMIERAPAGAPVAGILRLPSDAAKTKDGGGTIGLPDLAMKIAERRYQGDPKGMLFTIESHKTQLRRISEDLGISPAFKLRDLRTTHLTWAKEGVGIDAAQAAGRHTNPRTTMCYIRQHAINLDALKAAHAVDARFNQVAPTQSTATVSPALPWVQKTLEKKEVGAGDEARTRDPQLGNGTPRGSSQ